MKRAIFQFGNEDGLAKFIAEMMKEMCERVSLTHLLIPPNDINADVVEQNEQMSELDALAIVVDLAKQNIIEDDEDMAEECERQTEAVAIVARMLHKLRIKNRVDLVIRSTQYTDDETDDPLYWSNELGWVSYESATHFTQEQANQFNHLPETGYWC